MKIRDRIRELRRVRAGDLTPNPRNWRTHPKAQEEALKGILGEIGYADALLARELPDGSLMLVDGHLRAGATPDQEVPVLILDITEAEADKLLLSLDPLAQLAETNAQALEGLLRDVQTGDSSLASMWEDLAKENGLLEGGDVEVKQVDAKAPPKMAWVLVGVPTVRYGEIQSAVDAIAAVPDATILSTVNDGADKD
jgi:hypothetical protein